MRSLLLVAFAAFALSVFGSYASAATVGDAARNTNTEWAAFAQKAPGADRYAPVYVRDVTPGMSVGPRAPAQTTFVDEVETVGALAGAGLLVTLAAVGLRRVWTQDPIRDPLGEGPGFL
jgi:hypothetical protein